MSGFPTTQIPVPQFAASQIVVRRSGIVALAAGMAVYLNQFRGLTVNVTAIGWDQEEQTGVNQGPGGANRIVLYPGKKPSNGTSDAGSFSRNHSPTRAGPRSIATWEKLITMSVWAVDATNLDDKPAQLTAAENLLEEAMCAIQMAYDLVTGTPVGAGNIVWGAGSWEVPSQNRGFGQEIRIEFTQLVPILVPDPALSHPKPVLVNPEQ